MTYQNFDQILADNTVDYNQRIDFATQWLKNSYGIVGADKDWIESLSSVHDHDNLPKHFGEVKIGSSFSSLQTKLVRLPEGWHLAVSSREGEDMAPIHPKHEPSFTSADNQKLNSRLLQVVKTGKLVVPVGARQVILPNFALDKSEGKEQGPDTSPVNFDEKTTSISIDMSQYL